MGYYTRHTLEWKEPEGFVGEPRCSHSPPPDARFCPRCGAPTKPMMLDEIVGRLIDANEEMSYALLSDGSRNESSRWYDYKDDMIALSKRLPDVLFTLSGEGQENDDMWREYYLGGKCQRAEAQITFDEFDPEKLI